MTLTGDLTATPVDDEVRFEYVVHNEGDEPVDLTFTSGQTADVVVHEANEVAGQGEGAGNEESGSDRPGDPVWRWSDGRMFTQAIETRTLGPGESLTAELTWDDPVAGSYSAEAALAANGRTVPATVAFGVE